MNVFVLSVPVQKHKCNIIVSFSVFAGRFRAERAYPHCPRGPRESLRRDARLRHQARGAAVQEGHAH